MTEKARSAVDVYASIVERMKNIFDKEKSLEEGKLNLNFNGVQDNRRLIKNLGNWVEKEGFLFFDSMTVPIPAGFNTKQNLYTYVNQLNSDFDIVDSVERFIDVAIKETSKVINDPTIVESRSFIFPDLSKMDNGKTASVVTNTIGKYFTNDKSKDRDVFTNVFSNASELNLTAVELETLVSKIDKKVPGRINDKLVRLSSLASTLKEVLTDDVNKPTLVPYYNEKIIAPLAEWCEALSIYLYQVNVVKVCFSDIEEHIRSLNK